MFLMRAISTSISHVSIGIKVYEYYRVKKINFQFFLLLKLKKRSYIIRNMDNSILIAATNGNVELLNWYEKNGYKSKISTFALQKAFIL